MLATANNFDKSVISMDQYFKKTLKCCYMNWPQTSVHLNEKLKIQSETESNVDWQRGRQGNLKGMQIRCGFGSFSPKTIPHFDI